MPGIENNISTIQTANQIPMVSSLNSGNKVVTDSYTIDPVTGSQKKRDLQPSVQQLQRGFIVASENGGPIDVAEIVDDADVDETGKISFPVIIRDSSNNIVYESDNMFKEAGGLFYGKKVYVESLKKYFYYSHKSDNSATEDDGWEPIE